MTAKRNTALRERYDPNEDYMPPVSALDLARQRFNEEHPEQTPAYCPIPACGYRGQGPGRPCPMVGNIITGAYGSGTHGPSILVPEVRR